MNTEQIMSLIADLRSRINPAYAAQLGTESYERRVCADTIDALVADIEFATEIYSTADKIAKDALAELAVLKALVVNTHKAKGRYHSQLAMCALYDACGLPNVKPISGEKS